ncbi:hypothetical protein AAZV13_05G081500 [Glycine max]
MQILGWKTIQIGVSLMCIAFLKKFHVVRLKCRPIIPCSDNFSPQRLTSNMDPKNSFMFFGDNYLSLRWSQALEEGCAKTNPIKLSGNNHILGGLFNALCRFCSDDW